MRISSVLLCLACSIVLAPSAQACVRYELQQGAWNIRFVNQCSYGVIVTWYCPGNCATGCATNLIPPGKSDNGYCNSQFKWNYKKWP
jgi:hypothetical protein